jgi:hypothetical protein
VKEPRLSPHERLPDAFRDLEAFREWSLATESERETRRLASTIEELRAFYDAITPRIEAIVAYLSQFALDEMPGEARSLLYLALSWTEIASAVEIYKQPTVINGLDPRRFARLKA